MSHDFEPTDAEKEMLSYMKDIEVNQKQTELGEIISGAILDGQNQIHDLYKEKATAQQIEYRMKRAYIYWMDRLNKANDQQLQKARPEGYEQGYTQGKFDEKMDAEYKHPEELQKAHQDWLREEIVKLKGMIHEINTEDEYAKYDGQNKAIQTIIDRYLFELDQDNK